MWPMTLTPIPLPQARAAARSDDLARIRAMGREHWARQAPWEERSLARIFRNHGEAGVLAALDAHDPRQAAARIMQLPASGWYRDRKGVGFWARPGLEGIWQALLSPSLGFLDTLPMARKDAWDVVLTQSHISKETARLATTAMDTRKLEPPSLLWPASHKHPAAWDAWKHALTPEYFLTPTGRAIRLPDNSQASTPPLYTLICYAKLLARGRLAGLLSELEQHPITRSLLAEHQPLLAWSAMQAGNAALFKRTRQWGDGPMALPGGMDLIEAGLTAANIPHGSWGKRWACMEQLGAGKPGVLERYLAKPHFLDRLLRVVSGGDAVHVVNVLTTAAEVGVDLSKLRDKNGVPLLDAFQERKNEYADQVASILQAMQLDRHTGGTPHTPARPRL